MLVGILYTLDIWLIISNYVIRIISFHWNYYDVLLNNVYNYTIRGAK